MNQFKPLDRLFPCGKDRLSGECVSVRVIVQSLTFPSPFYFQWKRKAVHVNASVNAFHMHRGLCREARTALGAVLTPLQLKWLKRTMAHCVDQAYRREAESSISYSEFVADLDLLCHWLNDGKDLD